MAIDDELPPELCAIDTELLLLDDTPGPYVPPAVLIVPWSGGVAEYLRWEPRPGDVSYLRSDVARSRLYRD